MTKNPFFLHTIAAFVSRWTGSSLPRIVVLFVGILFVCLVAVMAWDLYLKHKIPVKRLGGGRPLRGTVIGAPLLICLTLAGVLFVGLRTPEPLLGDEVTHYYMLRKQAQDLNVPNFTAEIPVHCGATETRHYPHPNLWHYLGAVVFRLAGNTFASVQFFQAFFLLQLLTVAYLLARSRRGIHTRSALLYVAVLASLPMVLIFSVTFYQDVPMTAQVLTAFYLLRRRQWLLATFFMCLALGIKVNAILFFPVFFVSLACFVLRRSGWLKGAVSITLAAIILIGWTWGVGRVINIYAHAEFYPVTMMKKILTSYTSISYLSMVGSGDACAAQAAAIPAANAAPVEMRARQKARVMSEQMAEIIANNPGDLREKVNFLVYGGILMWLVMTAGVIGMVATRFGCGKPCKPDTPPWDLLAAGLAYIAAAAWMLKTAPDARFFLPGLPLLLLPFTEYAVCLPRAKALLVAAVALAVLQGGYVLAKTHALRGVSPELQEAIAYLEKSPPNPHTVFMYPEGNYRLFPVDHRWYLKYHLREFWRADNDLRIAVLHRFGIGAIVVKKYLIAEVDEAITNLGVYPTYFVRQIEQDHRFRKVFDNKAVSIYLVPAAEHHPGSKSSAH